MAPSQSLIVTARTSSSSLQLLIMNIIYDRPFHHTLKFELPLCFTPQVTFFIHYRHDIDEKLRLLEQSFRVTSTKSSQVQRLELNFLNIIILMLIMIPVCICTLATCDYMTLFN